MIQNTKQPITRMLVEEKKHIKVINFYPAHDSTFMVEVWFPTML